MGASFFFKAFYTFTIIHISNELIKWLRVVINEVVIFIQSSKIDFNNVEYFLV